MCKTFVIEYSPSTNKMATLIERSANEIGYVGVFVGGDIGAFTGGAMPGILAGISLLILLVIPKRSSSR